ncbi:MAG: hypothetical protein OFPII_18210 [Osedax symbiont Rs1]|nr:MAG: hypothetical protein OFPII_18210 [Osedax symbiont Rs1]
MISTAISSNSIEDDYSSIAPQYSKFKIVPNISIFSDNKTAHNIQFDRSESTQKINAAPTLKPDNTPNHNSSLGKRTDKIEAHYNCIIEKIDTDAFELEARVYDTKSQVQVMVIKIPFTSFSVDEQSLIRENSIFYWKIGSRVTRDLNKKGTQSNSSVNFSEYQMRRLYVSRRSLKGRLESQIEQFSRVFSDPN